MWLGYHYQWPRQSPEGLFRDLTNAAIWSPSVLPLPQQYFDMYIQQNHFLKNKLTPNHQIKHFQNITLEELVNRNVSLASRSYWEAVSSDYSTT